MTPVEVASLLTTADNFLIITHKKPDGDTIGSSSALCHALKKCGKTVYLFKNPEITERYLPYSERYFAPDGFVPDFVICVDVAATDMVAKGADYQANLVIDHHPTNPEFGIYNCIYSDKSSCGEIILEIIEALNGELDKSEANLLYIAVSTDTGCFQYGNTNARTFEAVSKLLGYGAQNFPLNTKFFRKVSKARIMLEGMIYSSIRYYHEGKVAVITVTRDMLEKCNASEDDLEDLAGIPGRVDTEIVGITIRENEDGSSKISVRSNEQVDSSAVCSYFGGGGHKMAAGCTIEADVEKAEKLVIEVLDSLWTASS